MPSSPEHISPSDQPCYIRCNFCDTVLARDDVINQALTTRAVLGSERALFGDAKGKMKVLSDKFPVIRGLFGDVQGKMKALGSIRRRRSRDNLILSAGIAACTLFLIIYWFSKELEM